MGADGVVRNGLTTPSARSNDLIAQRPLLYEEGTSSRISGRPALGSADLLDLEITLRGFVMPEPGDRIVFDFAVDNVVVQASAISWCHHFHVNRAGLWIECSFLDVVGFVTGSDVTTQYFSVPFQCQPHLGLIAWTGAVIAEPHSAEGIRSFVLRRQRRHDTKAQTDQSSDSC
jgi:hypothetical protein